LQKAVVISRQNKWSEERKEESVARREVERYSVVENGRQWGKTVCIARRVLSSNHKMTNNDY
jgi:hypothetical protein